jgi:uncharacterized protein (DUF885 family)
MIVSETARTLPSTSGQDRVAVSRHGGFGSNLPPVQRSGVFFRRVRTWSARGAFDTGMHTMGWSREQALDYVNAHPPQVSPTEVDRYISWPGQALSYKMDQLKILELRKEAEQKLGPKFDVRDFHDAILRDGPLPLDLLQLQVE